MTKIFKPLIGQTMEVYIDDIVVKSKTRVKHVQHLEETFHLMLAYDMKLNPTKCTFGINARKGFMVTQRGIEVNSVQIEVVLKTPVPSNKKEMQRLTSRLAALGRFIAHFMNKFGPFFLTLKVASTFFWTDECKQPFETVKRYLTEPPILSSPKSDEQLYIYLVVSDYAVSVILFRHIQDKEYRLIYYVSKAMVNVETQYPIMEHTALTLKNVAQNLRPYFQAHQVTILTNQPLRVTLHKPDLSRRMLKWVIELSEYEIKYQPRLSLKGQVISDFIAKLTQKQAHPVDRPREQWWTLHVDETSRVFKSGVGLILQSPTKELME